jgi:hypothetical protein
MDRTRRPVELAKAGVDQSGVGNQRCPVGGVCGRGFADKRGYAKCGRLVIASAFGGNQLGDVRVEHDQTALVEHVADASDVGSVWSR